MWFVISVGLSIMEQAIEIRTELGGHDNDATDADADADADADVDADADDANYDDDANI